MLKGAHQCQTFTSETFPIVGHGNLLGIEASRKWAADRTLFFKIDSDSNEADQQSENAHAQEAGEAEGKQPEHEPCQGAEGRKP